MWLWLILRSFLYFYFFCRIAYMDCYVVSMEGMETKREVGEKYKIVVIDKKADILLLLSTIHYVMFSL